jgi:hypothetical protein
MAPVFSHDVTHGQSIILRIFPEIMVSQTDLYEMEKRFIPLLKLTAQMYPIAEAPLQALCCCGCKSNYFADFISVWDRSIKQLHEDNRVRF